MEQSCAKDQTTFDAAHGSQLLSAIRAELTLDSSDSEESASPARPDHPATEPFPDYFECEQAESRADPQHEEAYKFAISKVVQEVIRFQEVEANIISLPPFAQATQNDAPSKLATGTVEAIDCQTAQHKRKILAETKQLLSIPRLRSETRRRFIALTNMVLHLNHVLFHRTTGNAVKTFLDHDDARDAKALSETILVYLAWIDNMLQEQVLAASQVAYILGQIVQEHDVTIYVQYRRMAHVVVAHLKKPRSLERRLLALFLELYEAWVHTTFLRLRNRQILLENAPNPERLELSRQLFAIWDVLTRCIENYALYTHTTGQIRERYLEPTMDQLCFAPQIWEQCWELSLHG